MEEGPDTTTHQQTANTTPHPWRFIAWGLAAVALLTATSTAWCQNLSGSELDKAVEKAIQKGRAALKATQKPDGSWSSYNPVKFPTGTAALAAYALLESGENLSSPTMTKAIKWLAQGKAETTYELSLRCNVWSLAEGASPGKFRKLLQADAKALLSGAGKGGYSYECPHPDNLNLYDNSNSQYGLLGAWAVSRSEAYEVPAWYWQNVMNHWRSCQNGDGGWGYSENTESTGSMTAGGLASLMVCYDHLAGSQFLNCKPSAEIQPLQAAIQRGLDWFSTHFEPALGKCNVANAPNDSDFYYYLYGVERVGLACGYKYFGDSDWYSRGANALLKEMKPQGGWRGGGSGAGWSDDIATSYALLFLSRGRNAVLFNKLQFPSVPPEETKKESTPRAATGPADKALDTDWNSRPRDMASLTSWVSGNFERTVNWQIINLKVPVAQWHDAPILYISGSREPAFTDEHIAKLRQYVLQGGTIFSCTQCDGKGFSQGIRAAYKKILPEYALEELPEDHEIYSRKTQFDIKGRVRFSAISNGIRPLVIHTDQDLPRVWQVNKSNLEPFAFQAAANVFIFVSDKTSLRARAQNLWPDEPLFARGMERIVRLKWEGNWDPEPLALERFGRLFAQQNSIKILIADPVAPRDLTTEVAPIAILSGVGPLKLATKDIDGIKRFVSQGGLLLVEAAGGNEEFAESARKVIEDIYGVDALRRPNSNFELFNVDALPDGKIDKVKYRRKTRSRIADQFAPMLRVMTLERNGRSRAAILFSREDFSNAGILGCQGTTIDGYDPGDGMEGTAYRLMRNIVLYSIQSRQAASPPAK